MKPLTEIKKGKLKREVKRLGNVFSYNLGFKECKKEQAQEFEKIINSLEEHKFNKDDDISFIIKQELLKEVRGEKE